MTETFVLRVFVAGRTPAGTRAIRALRETCSSLGDRYSYELEVIDILQFPERAEEEKILATPTVVKVRPPPSRRVIGDLSDREQMLVSLDLVQEA